MICLIGRCVHFVKTLFHKLLVGGDSCGNDDMSWAKVTYPKARRPPFQVAFSFLLPPTNEVGKLSLISFRCGWRM